MDSIRITKSTEPFGISGASNNASFDHRKEITIDPDECFAMILENIVHGEWSDAAENAENLRDWMMNGGFPPGGRKLCKTSIYALLRWLITHPNRDD